ncbi:MAG: dTDP-4-dehydrorhamnose reductase [Pseudomonadota bacterium]
MARFLVFGASGQVGQELCQSPSALPVYRSDVDLTDKSAIKSVFESMHFDAVVNAAAYTDVERAETDADLCFKINAEAPKLMAALCAEKNVPFLHISSEFVFDGKLKRPYTEEDACNPLSVYGQSKFQGEQNIISSNAAYIILRTSWVFSKQQNNFVRKIMRAAQNQRDIQVVEDQIGAPTAASQISDAILALLPTIIADPECLGIYHFASKPNVSRFEFAKEILQMAGLDTVVSPVKSDAFPTTAERPKNSCLDSTKIFDQFGIEVPDWRVPLKSILSMGTEIDAN